MDPTEIVKHIPGAAAALASSKIVADLVTKMLGPAADEVGQWSKDKIKAYRTQNANKVLEEAGKMLAESNIKPQPVPTKILLPLLEGASLEDNEDMQEMWAALLVSAANGVSNARFKTILSELSSDDAKLLQWIAGQEEEGIAFSELQASSATWALNDSEPDPSDLQFYLDGLEYAQLIYIHTDEEPDRVYLTELGNRFVAAVTPPQPKP